MLHFARRDLGRCLDPDRIFFGEGRGEFGICLHVPLKDHMAGAAPAEDYMLMLAFANMMVEYLRYKRTNKGPELWDYDPEAATEAYAVCGDNPSSSGVILRDSVYSSGPKIQVFLDKTFGANEVSIRWKNQLIGDEKLLGDFEEYLKQALRNGELCPEESGPED